MYFKDKFYTLNMRENGSLTKHIHLFCTNLHQLVTVRTWAPDDEAIICLMKSTPLSYRTFLSSL